MTQEKNGSDSLAAVVSNSGGAACRRCRFFKPGRQADDAGECRKIVPHVLAMPGQTLAGAQGIRFQSYWPPVAPGEWCGAFESAIGTA